MKLKDFFKATVAALILYLTLKFEASNWYELTFKFTMSIISGIMIGKALSPKFEYHDIETYPDKKRRYAIQEAKDRERIHELRKEDLKLSDFYKKIK